MLELLQDMLTLFCKVCYSSYVHRDECMILTNIMRLNVSYYLVVHFKRSLGIFVDVKLHSFNS